MKKIFMATMILFLLVGCSAKTETKEGGKKEEKLTVIDKLPDFPNPLNTFVNTYNENGKNFDNLPNLTDPGELEYAEFNKQGDIYKSLIVHDSYDIKAVFSKDQTFKRVIYNNNGNEMTGESANALTNIFYTIGADPNYINDFLDSGKDKMDISDNYFKISFWLDKSIELLNVTIDKDNKK